MGQTKIKFRLASADVPDAVYLPTAALYKSFVSQSRVTDMFAVVLDERLFSVEYPVAHSSSTTHTHLSALLLKPSTVGTMHLLSRRRQVSSKAQSRKRERTRAGETGNGDADRANEGNGPSLGQGR